MKDKNLRRFLGVEEDKEYGFLGELEESRPGRIRDLREEIRELWRELSELKERLYGESGYVSIFGEVEGRKGEFHLLLDHLGLEVEDGKRLVKKRKKR